MLSKLYDAVRKYGIEQFEITVLLIINLFGKTQDEIKKELNAQEIFYINLYESYEKGYNSTPGGDSGRLGFQHSKQTIQKIKGESISDISHKTQIDYRSIGHICNNSNYKKGGRFIAAGRYLFSFEKEDLYDRISWYYSEEYSYRKKHRKHG